MPEFDPFDDNEDFYTTIRQHSAKPVETNVLMLSHAKGDRLQCLESLAVLLQAYIGSSLCNA